MRRRVKLGGGDVAVAQELLDLTDIDAGIKEQGGRGRAQGKGTSADPEGECDAALEALGPSVEAIAAYWRLRWQTETTAANEANLCTPALRPGRNDSCTCGSGRKFKKCCARAPNFNQYGSE